MMITMLRHITRKLGDAFSRRGGLLRKRMARPHLPAPGRRILPRARRLAAIEHRRAIAVLHARASFQRAASRNLRVVA